MKKSLCILILSTIIAQQSFSQTDSTDLERNHLYLELAGAGGYGSINYERVIYLKEHFTFTVRAGISTQHIVDFTNKFNPDIIVPFALNGLYGLNHKLELGIGETYSNIVHVSLTNFNPKRESSFSTYFSIGYRYQKKEGRFVFRCVYTPIIEFNKYLRHWAGISFGYSF